MEVLTGSTARLLSMFTRLTDNSFLRNLPESLPVQPCILTQHNDTQIPIPEAYYFSIFFIFGGGLYILLLWNFTLRQKQWMAAPLVACLFTLPLIFTTLHSPTLQLVHVGACGCVLMRMIDLYYVRPWRTGKEPTMNLEDWWREIWQPFRKVPMSKDQLQRYELELEQSKLRRELEKKRQQGQQQQQYHQEHGVAKATSDSDDKGSLKMNLTDTHTKTTTNEPSPDSKDTITTITATSDAAKPTTGKPQKQIYTPPIDPNPQHWSVYLPRWLAYAAVMDIIAFSFSFLTFEQIQSFSMIPTLLVRIGVSGMLIFDISLANYTIMIIWATVTGDLIRDTEWTLVRHYFPGFATSPAEFWRQWHHLFQYIWVDLGFKPVHHLLRKHVTPKTPNKALARALELALPVMGVFLMSGLQHEFMMMSMWHIRPGHMTAFFLIQGAATILSKGLNNTVGKKIKVPNMILIALTWAFNLSTAGLFMEPVLKNQGYNLAVRQSLLVHAYNFLRSNGVF
ncbi:hypothetical protein BGX28_010247 [Mortierella sp. GBA30]|nr:hypothetical protein BGX28_010247 [Mortierella sp. GBA30]